MTVITVLERQVSAALERSGYSGNSTRLVVAVSGGPDSSALLLSLYRLRPRHGLDLHVAHLNHDFRGDEADEDAQFVTQMSHQLGLPVTVEKRDPLEYQQQRRISSFELAAREMRYSFLSRVAQEIGAAAVAVGHTLDDLAETVLMHILRGSGLSGLRSMTELAPWPWKLTYGQLSLFRPLLEVAKADTAAYCQELGHTYRRDTGNSMHRFTRNRIRHDLMPRLASEYNPRIRDSLVRLSRTAALSLDYLEGEAGKLLPEVSTSSPGLVRFDRHRMAGLHPAMQRALLRRGFASLVGDTLRLTETHVSAMASLVSSPSGQTIELPAGVRLHSSTDYLELTYDMTLSCPFPLITGQHAITLPNPEQPETVTQVDSWRVTARWLPYSGQPFDRDPWSAYLNPASLAANLRVRVRQPGDRFQPLGMNQYKKLQDFFTDARIPRTWRSRVPLLVSGQEDIAWVLGYRIAHWARVQPQGHDCQSPVLWIRFELEPQPA